jgi:FtsP/CotA-like multicopper oxidase with cupredoxin domain
MPDVRSRIVCLLVVPVAFAWAAHSARPSAAPERVRPNDNRVSAGTLQDGALRLELEARLATWHPDGDSLPGIAVEAFNEPGRAPVVPAPLIRVPRGTDVRVSVRNALGDTLTFHLPSGPAGATDSVRIAPGASGELRVRADAPGTYLYRAVTTDRTARTLRVAGLLAGAVVVDSAPLPAPARDRVFVLQSAADTIEGLEMRRAVHAVNGRSWPHTERLEGRVGDTLRWRVVNASVTVHPMHLHGFYFRVDALDGPDVAADGQGAPGRLVVTERMSPFSTMAVTWGPERPGNWLFHCHFQEHVLPHGVLNGVGPDGRPRRIGAALLVPDAHAAHAPDADHARTAMGGPVLGIRVRGSAGTPARLASAVRVPGAERRLRLVAVQDPGVGDTQPAMRFVLHDPSSGRRTDTGRDVSPTLDLLRDEPVAITVLNTMREPVAVHWHGIELESFYDGVPGFSGDGRRVAPLIAPGDSFVARFAPPRAGTFMYHSHVEEPRQHRAGLVGALLVRDRATRDRPDTAAEDLVFVYKTARLGGLDAEGLPREVPVPIQINGQADPDTTVLRAGRRYRFRLVGLPTGRPNTTTWLTARPDSSYANLRDTLVVRWRPVAKDGRDLPPAEQAPRLARQIVSMGETYDFEYVPAGPGTLRLEVRAAGARGRLLARAPIRVRAPAPAPAP